MGTSEFSKLVCRLLGQRSSPPPDRTVDSWIRETLVEDALAQFPAGTWERLRKVIVERKFRKYGMWVLDEPWREPQETSAPPALPHHNQLKFYGEYDKKVDYSWQQWQAREAVWNNMMPIFPSWVNW